MKQNTGLVQGRVAVISLCWLAVGFLGARAAAAPPKEASKSADGAAQGGLTTAAAFARQFPGPVECAQAAKDLLKLEDPRAWTLMAGCTERDDFRDLDLLLTPPWLEMSKNRPDGLAAVARVIAIRKRFLAEDIAQCNEAGIKVHDLEKSLELAGKKRTTPVMFRAQVVASKRGRDGVETLVEAVEALGPNEVKKRDPSRSKKYMWVTYNRNSGRIENADRYTYINYTTGKYILVVTPGTNRTLKTDEYIFVVGTLLKLLDPQMDGEAGDGPIAKFRSLQIIPSTE